MRAEPLIRTRPGTDLAERAIAQPHVHDLRELPGDPLRLAGDPKGDWYAFEKGATKTTSGEGLADVLKKGHFALEYKRKGRSLDDALDRRERYALALDKPPLVAICERARLRLVGNWTSTVRPHAPDRSRRQGRVAKMRLQRAARGIAQSV